MSPPALFPTRARRALFGALVLGTLVSALGLWRDPRHAFFAYFAALLAVLSVSLGALLLVMITHAARARWFVALRRVAEAWAGTLPLFAVLFVPVLLRLPVLYASAREAPPPGEQAAAWWAHVRGWLAPGPFAARACLCLAVWAILAELLLRASRAHDRDGAEALLARQRFLSAAGLPLVATTLTLAAFDWLLPLDAGYASTMAGVSLFASAFTGAVAALSLGAWGAKGAGSLQREVGPSHIHALGRLLLTSVIFWTYIAVVQLILVWIGNLPREVGYYQLRVRGGWALVSAVLLGSHFVLPFTLLLLHGPKRRARAVGVMAAGLVVAHALDLYWAVVPASESGPQATDAGIFVAFFALSALAAAYRFAGAAPFPERDPALAESLRYEAT